MLQPPFWPKNVVFFLHILNRHWCWTKTLKAEKKTKLRKRDLKKKQRTKKTEIIDERQTLKLIFWCCTFHETKTKKQEKKTKRQKQGKNKKEGTHNKREREREREREKEKTKKGEEKRLRRNKGRHWKLNKIAFFLLDKNKQEKWGVRAKWGGPSGHLTWPLNPPKQNKNKKERKKRKTRKNTKWAF